MTTPFTELQPLRPLMDACVHCGFCLPTCPSYLLLGQEMDSPRGRIFLMKAGLDERAAMTPPVVEHFDTCLGCMACETACPSGVRYAPLIEHTRAELAHELASSGLEQKETILLWGEIWTECRPLQRPASPRS